MPRSARLSLLVAVLLVPGGVTAGQNESSGEPGGDGAHATAAAAVLEPKVEVASFVDEIRLSAYLESSGVVNLAGSRGDVNELRFYDFESDYSFNMAELGLKKDPSGAHPFGFGLTVTAGRDAQKNHALGLLRDEDDVFPFEDTPEFDLQEVYASYRVPVGGGLTLKAGKFVTLLGYEVIEGPQNLNASRSLLFVYSIPLTHVGALASYAISDRIALTGGPVVGWDVLEDNNGRPSWMGQLAFTPAEALATNLQWIAGPEQFGTEGLRWVLDLVASYTAIEGLTLGLNADYGREVDEPSLVAAGAPGDWVAGWWGLAGYGAYDLTEKLRTAGRLEYFEDSDGVRTLARGAGERVSLWEMTVTLQLDIWNGLVGRLEYRHDAADQKVFDQGALNGAPGSKTQDTVALAIYYSFF